MFQGKSVFVSGAARGFGQSLAWNFASQGARVFVSGRKLDEAEKSCELIRTHCEDADVHPVQCDLTRIDDIQSAAAKVKEQNASLDILVNNGAMWLSEEDFSTTPDEAIVAVMQSGATGPLLLTKHFLPLLQASPAADIVNMVSKCGESGFLAPGPHEAFYAMKHAHAGFADILRQRLRHSGIRVLSLFPPDFENTSPFDSSWGKVRADEGNRLLNAKSIIDMINFSIAQPRSCYISNVYFEGNRRSEIT